jgi:hypothetical protein
MSGSDNNLESYLVRLAQDAMFRALAERDPEASFAGYSLTQEQRAELRNPGPGMLVLLGEALTSSGRFTPTEKSHSAAPPQPDLAAAIQGIYAATEDSRLSQLMALVRDFGHRHIEGPKPPGRPRDITIVGLGIMTVDHITREAEAALSAANEVLYVDTGIATHAFLSARCTATTSLFADSYAEGRTRVEAYEYMAARVLEAGLQNPPVVFAIQGHPLVFCQPPFLIDNLAKLFDLGVKICPGISAIDTITVDLGFDPCTEGLQLYEATDLLLRERPLQPDVPALVWQVGAVESRLHTAKVSSPQRFRRFQEYLLNYYPADHTLIAVYSSPFPTMPATSFRFTIAELCAQAAYLHPGLTLFIPAISQRPVANADLLQDIDDRSHLDTLTTPETT